MESYIGKGDVVEAKVFIEHSGWVYVQRYCIGKTAKENTTAIEKIGVCMRLLSSEALHLKDSMLEICI